MSDQLESTGKTVDEAIREALLRMGLRREEVDVTVVQSARSGILGVGRRQAVVKVSKKPGGGQTGRDRRDAAGDDNRRGRGRQSGERLDSGRGGRSGRGDERRGDVRRGGRARGGAKVETQETAGRDDRDSRSSRGGRGGRGRGGARQGDQAPAMDPTASGATQDTQREQPAPTSRDDADQRGDASDGKGRRRRPRRRRKRSESEGQLQSVNSSGQAAPMEQEPIVADTFDSPVEADTAAPTVEVDQSRARTTPPPVEQSPAETMEPAAVDRTDEAGQQGPAAQDAPPPRRETPRRESGDGVLAAEVAASARVAPLTAAEAAELPDFLQRVATELMVKCGFPCRVQVLEGDYHLVKLVVDDRSAGVLIGRYGNTVDAVEYLVEKIASKAAGDRVRMNLDINNYRMRREDQLVQRVRNAAAEARNTGEPVAMEPASGRERRIVHLYIQETGDLTTYTEDHQDGKYVVICRPDQVPPQHQKSDQDEDSGGDAAAEPRQAQPQIEVSAVIDVDSTSAPHEEPERTD